MDMISPRARTHAGQGGAEYDVYDFPESPESADAGGGDEEYSMPGKGKGKGEGIGEAVDDGEGLASALAQLVV